MTASTVADQPPTVFLTPEEFKQTYLQQLRKVTANPTHPIVPVAPPPAIAAQQQVPPPTTTPPDNELAADNNDDEERDVEQAPPSLLSWRVFFLSLWFLAQVDGLFTFTSHPLPVGTLGVLILVNRLVEEVPRAPRSWSSWLGYHLMGFVDTYLIAFALEAFLDDDISIASTLLFLFGYLHYILPFLLPREDEGSLWDPLRGWCWRRFPAILRRLFVLSLNIIPSDVYTGAMLSSIVPPSMAYLALLIAAELLSAVFQRHYTLRALSLPLGPAKATLEDRLRSLMWQLFVGVGCSGWFRINDPMFLLVPVLFGVILNYFCQYRHYSKRQISAFIVQLLVMEMLGANPTAVAIMMLSHCVVATWTLEVSKYPRGQPAPVWVDHWWYYLWDQVGKPALIIVLCNLSVDETSGAGLIVVFVGCVAVCCIPRL